MMEPTKENKHTDSVHFGDDDFDAVEDFGDASWSEVFEACCVHTAEEWLHGLAGFLLCCFFLYFFLFGLNLLGNGAKVMTGCKAGELFGDDTNPIAGLMIGILATVLLQSSSTTTSIIVSLVGSAISVRQGIFMIMGANIGTSMTNTIVAMGQMGDGDQLERAFAGATVHDMFNFMTVAVLLPVEVITGFLKHLTGAIIKDAETEKGDKWEGPVKKLVSPLGSKIIKSNKDIIKDIAKGKASCDPDPEGKYYPINCTDGVSYKSCVRVGLISCDKKTGKCPAFFQADATAKEDKISGGVIFFISIFILFTCLLGLVTVLQKMLLGMSTRIIYKATDVNGYVAIVIGTLLTILVQSSSITTSTLTPLVGMGALRLEQMLPLTLGANIGTTMTAIMSAMVTDGTKALQVALAHLFFNLSGIALFYPFPFMRRIPLNAARQLGRATRIWRGFPVVYIAVMFFLIPMLFLGISFFFEQGSKGYNVLGSFVVIFLALVIGYTFYYCNYLGGREECLDYLAKREKTRMTMEELPDDMEYLKAKVAALLEHTGMPVDDDDDAVVSGDDKVEEDMAA